MSCRESIRTGWARLRLGWRFAGIWRAHDGWVVSWLGVAVWAPTLLEAWRLWCAMRQTEGQR